MAETALPRRRVVTGALAVFLALCAVAFWWGVPHVQRDLERQARNRLEAAGLSSVVQVSADGLDVDLTGPRDAEPDAVAAVQAVRGVRHVHYRVLDVVVNPTSAGVSTSTTPDTDAVGVVDLLATVKGGASLTLEGSVATDDQRSVVNAAAMQAFGSNHLAANVNVTHESGASSDDAVRRFATVVTLLPGTVVDGSVRLQGSTLSVTGDLADDAALTRLTPVLAEAEKAGLAVVRNYRIGTTPGSSSAGSTAPGSSAASPSTTKATSSSTGRTTTTIGAKSGNVQAQIDAILAAAPIGFEYKSTQLTGASVASLKRIASVLAANPAAKVQVVGHTDAIGDAAENQRRSLQRAQAAVDQLVQFGVSRGRLTAVGKGESDPLPGIDPNSDRQRRVDVIVVS